MQQFSERCDEVLSDKRNWRPSLVNEDLVRIAEDPLRETVDSRDLIFLHNFHKFRDHFAMKF